LRRLGRFQGQECQNVRRTTHNVTTISAYVGILLKNGNENPKRNLFHSKARKDERNKKKHGRGDESRLPRFGGSLLQRAREEAGKILMMGKKILHIRHGETTSARVLNTLILAEISKTKSGNRGGTTNTFPCSAPEIGGMWKTSRR